MPRAPKQCGHHGCPTRVPGGRTYCPLHEAARQSLMASRRPSTTARGYGYQHKQLRIAWTPAVEAGLTTCWRCGEPIQQGQAWDMGHQDDDRTQPALPEHAGMCNRSTAGQQPARARGM